jgi:RNA polymerase sigma factor (sigma-70 family)
MPLDLVERLRRGDEHAYREAVALHGDNLYSFLLRLCGQRELAEDLFQETWLALARHAMKLPSDTRLAPWLYAVARNAYCSHRRWAWVDVSRWLVVDHDDTLASPEASPEQVAVAEQTADDLDIALRRLRPCDREILLLHAVDGLDASEVAAILGLDPGAQRQRLSRARKALREQLDRIR